MQVRVLYMGMLREIAGCERDVIQLADGASVGELFAQLRQRTPQARGFPRCHRAGREL